MSKHINLVKLSVGTESIEGLRAWQSSPMAQTRDGLPRHVTRMWPKRADEILAGGSLYWVIKGVIMARQRIVALDERRGSDGIARCALVLDAEVIRTEGAARRPFQGWRYLDPADSPRDLPKGRALDDKLPPSLAQALAEIGLR